MGNFIKKSWIAITSTTLLTPVAFMAVSVAAPGIASARCAGVGSEVRSTLVVNGAELVAEAPDSGTCNANGAYSGHFAAKQAGWRAWVLIQNNGQWVGFPGGGYDLLNNNFSYGDANSHSLMALCADDGSITICGWGTVSEPDILPNFTIPASGVNSGF